jgi:hypothetical protein
MLQSDNCSIDLANLIQSYRFHLVLKQFHNVKTFIKDLDFIFQFFTAELI